MEYSVFNFVEIRATISRKFKSLIAISLLCAVLGAVFYMVTPKKYEAKTDFIIRNPIYNDRNNIYNYDTKFIDFFGNEEDANRIIMLSGSDIVQKQVIRNNDLFKLFKIDTTNSKVLLEFEKKFDKNLVIIRTENKDLLLSYTDTDPDRAAKVANNCVEVLENTFGDFYADMRKSMHQIIMDKISEEDSIISSLTDTLAKVREKYGIYDIISPSRHNLLNGAMKDNNHKNYGLGIELVQNIESLKDEIVADRAVKTTLANQYTSTYSVKRGNGRIPILKVITPAKPPLKAKGLGGLLTVITCGIVGLFIATIFILFFENFISKKPNKESQ